VGRQAAKPYGMMAIENGPFVLPPSQYIKCWNFVFFRTVLPDAMRAVLERAML
jgi:hypothetical protein